LSRREKVLILDFRKRKQRNAFSTVVIWPSKNRMLSFYSAAKPVARPTVFELVRFAFLAALTILLMPQDDTLAQVAKNKSAQIGDIISYTRNQGGTAYGMVVRVDTYRLELEQYDENDELEFEAISSNELSSAEMIVSMNQSVAEQTRVWKTSKGNFEITASLEDFDGTTVKLKKENNKVVSVPLAKLSSADRQFLKNYSSPKKQSGNADNPFAGGAADELPVEVQLLLERRDELIEEQRIHQQFAKINPNMLLGDVVKYEHHREYKYGLVVKVSSTATVETYDDDGKPDSDLLLPSKRWWFVDREAPKPQPRKWLSSDGKFSIDAALTGVEGKDAVLTKPDGKTLNVPISKLSRDDRRYITRNKGKLGAVVPSELTDRRATYGPNLEKLLQRRAVLFERIAANIAVAKDTAKLKGIALTTEPIQLDAASLMPKQFNSKPFSVTVSVPAGLHPRVKKVCYADQARKIAFAVSSPFSSISKLAVVDVATAKTILNKEDDELGIDAEVVAYSPSGGTVLLISETPSRDRQMELWKFDGEKLIRKSVVSYDSVAPPSAYLFSDELGVLLSDRGDFTFIETVDRIKPTHLVQNSGSSIDKPSIRLCNDGKHVCLISGKQDAMYVIDAATKACVGGINFPNSDHSYNDRLDFETDGKTLVRLNQKSMQKFDIRSGDLISKKESTSPWTIDRNGASPYLGQNLVRLFEGSIYFFDLDVTVGKFNRSVDYDSTYLSKDARIKVEVNRPGSRSTGGTMLGSKAARQSPAFSDRSKLTPVSVQIKLERLNLSEITQHASQLTTDDVIEFDSGDQLQLDIQVQGDVASELRDLITDRMESNAIEIADQSDFVMELSYHVGRPQTETFNIVGGPTRRVRKVTVKPKTCRAVLKYKGQTIWSRIRSVSLGRPFSEEALDQTISNEKNISARSLLEFKYPTQLRIISPDKQQTFSWR
jgi:hypothetical protein